MNSFNEIRYWLFILIEIAIINLFYILLVIGSVLTILGFGAYALPLVIATSIIHLVVRVYLYSIGKKIIWGKYV